MELHHQGPVRCTATPSFCLSDYVVKVWSVCMHMIVCGVYAYI